MGTSTESRSQKILEKLYRIFFKDFPKRYATSYLCLCVQKFALY